jgi:CBS domain-containing protein
MGLQHDLCNKQIGDMPLREPVCVAPGMTVRLNVDRMRQQQIGCALVVNDEGKPVGEFTEKELTAYVLNDSGAMDRIMSDCMADLKAYVKRSDPIARVISLMQRHDLRFVCVVDEQGRVAGLTGQRGLMEYMADHFRLSVAASRVGARPYIDRREGA